MNRVFNFSAGPCCLPVDVLMTSQHELLNWHTSGQSVMEMSHRGKHFSSIYHQTVADLKELLEVPGSHEILFMQGGATLQFAAVPMNLFSDLGKCTADYIITGSWSQKAQQECTKYGMTHIACDASIGTNGRFVRIPSVEEWNITKNATYLHYCANETIMGVEFQSTPKVDIPLVSDMSSNFCSRAVNVTKHAIIYAGVQKNLGPAGCAVLIVDKDLINSSKPLSCCPTMMNYKTTMKNDSMYNTPPCWTIYMVGLMAKHLKATGGLSSAEERNIAKSDLLYDYIDSTDGYYLAAVKNQCRSRMNVPFRVGHSNTKLESLFVEEAETHGLINLSGHRSVGGCRASLYNGMPLDGVEKLIDFMKVSISIELHIACCRL